MMGGLRRLWRAVKLRYLSWRILRAIKRDDMPLCMEDDPRTAAVRRQKRERQ